MKQYARRSLAFILAMVIIVACGAIEAEPSATVGPQTCPTAPACPATAAQIPSAENTWAAALQGASAIEITFEPGEICTVDAPDLLGQGRHYYSIKVKDQAHATYAVIFQTLDEGKTLEDLQAYPKTATTEPSWDTIIRENYVGPGTNSYYEE
ncbi:MAG: hypothetical protein ACM3H7_06750, partial [Acidobacteriaceae bacterium]